MATKKPVQTGDRFDQMEAVEFSHRDAKGNVYWRFRCDCSAEVTWRVTTVSSNARTMGWSSCPDCWRAEVARRSGSPQ